MFVVNVASALLVEITSENMKPEVYLETNVISYYTEHPVSNNKDRQGAVPVNAS